MKVYRIDVEVENAEHKVETEVHFQCAASFQEVFESQSLGYDKHELVAITRVIESVYMKE